MIDIQGLGFRYRRSGAPVFSNLNLQLPAGTICGLLGSNGAGKSTLLRLMAGLSFAQQGRCTVLGQPPADRTPEFLADVFLLPEEFQLPAMEATDYEKRIGALYPRFDGALFNRLLGELSIPRPQKLNTLSQGQKKKFLLAFGLATQARLMILDEPTNGLDIPSKSQFRRLMIDQFQPERSFLISTHQVHDLQGLIDSVMVLDQGQILLHQTVEALESRLQITVEQEQPQDALYVEKSLEGFKVIRENHGGHESRLDLEMMFGLVTTGPTRVRELFSPETRV
ncbi:MAG: ABC transporter ATP-binding protein [Steroidobacteraceae bacterium]